MVVLCALGLMASEVRRWFEVAYEMFTQAMGDERRQAGYLRDLLMTRPAAKEVRLFHWLPWMDDRINRVWTAAMRTVWAVRSQSLRTVLLVTLVSVIGSLLAFDQFYIMTAGQPLNMTATSVFYVYLNSFPFLKLGYGAALSLILSAIVLLFTVGQMILTRRSHA